MLRGSAMDNKILSFRDLDVWQLAMDLADLDTELEISFRNGFLKRENCARTVELCGRVGLMLNRLHDSLD